MVRMIVVVLSTGAALLCGAAPAGAFWERSQVIRCADATTPAERQRHRCWELGVYADPGWPQLGAIGVVVDERAVPLAPHSRRGAVYK